MFHFFKILFFLRPQQTVLFCRLMGASACGFKLGTASRDEVASHFTGVHKFTLRSAESGAFRGSQFVEVLKRRGKTREACGPISFEVLGDGPMSPLFLLMLRTNTPPGYFSPICVQVWGPDNDAQKPKSYQAEFSFKRDKNDVVTGAKLPVSSIKLV